MSELAPPRKIGLDIPSHMISMKCMQDHTSKHSMDMVTVGERGQVVIPAALREKLQINPGDKLMVFTKHNEMLCLVPASNMRHLVEVLTAQISEMENGTENNAKQEG